MQDTARFGRLIGWVSIVCGAAVVAIGLLAESPQGAIAEFERCEAQRRIGIRSSPCVMPAGTDKVVVLAAGFGGIASGVFFLLLSGILTTLLEIKAGQADKERRRDPQPRLQTAPEVAPTYRALALPTRFEMQQRYGEALGNRAWALMDRGLREGEPLTEQDAVIKARSEAQAGHG